MLSCFRNFTAMLLVKIRPRLGLMEPKVPFIDMVDGIRDFKRVSIGIVFVFLLPSLNENFASSAFFCSCMLVLLIALNEEAKS